MKLRAAKIIDILDTAGTAERFMPGLNSLKPTNPSMYKILRDITYEPKDYGYWNKTKKLKLRANSKQIDCWLLAIDLLPKVELKDRKLVWSRAIKHSWVSLAKMYSCHRVTIKRRYIKAIINLEFSLDKSLIDKIDKI